MLGYSLLARPGTRQQEITEVFAHPVALAEARPWLDRVMPQARRTEAASGGDAARRVALGATLDKASVGPRIGASIYGLVSLVDGIEEGPHNVTRWWVLGRETPAPSGRDKTSLLAAAADEELAGLLARFGEVGVQIAHHLRKAEWEVAGHAPLPDRGRGPCRRTQAASAAGPASRHARAGLLPAGILKCAAVATAGRSGAAITLGAMERMLQCEICRIASENAAKTPIRIAVSVCVLVAVVKRSLRRQCRRSFRSLASKRCLIQTGFSSDDTRTDSTA